MSSHQRMYLLAATSIAALVGVPFNANAQDRITSVWTGAYMGVHGGVAAQQSTTYDLNGFGPFVFFSAGTGSVTQNRTSGLAGGHVGYNWQSRRLVYGVEADIAGAFGGNADVTLNQDLFGGTIFQQTYSTELKWLSTFRGRAGLELDGTLAFVTAGLAVAGIRNRWGQGFTDGTPLEFADRFVDTGARFGWTVGGGIEHRFSPNWSARLEGLFMDFGRSRKTITATSAGGTDTGNFSAQWENTAIVARAGLTYHFGTVN
ncbi:MAG: outer membrane beta-barrel protein [Bradyrhizobium sp.]|uniref:outer membrane protein n=1 Tax=Bradyrhizobium sp. TaxID=376 RepID=UPI00273209E7|nr:outer membrane beta-barrel protein [Bradyrhizobium sp.]MDP1866664.1 outer membrane beta-barrel protein [Bradyrhizobium sp.]